MLILWCKIEALKLDYGCVGFWYKKKTFKFEINCVGLG
jgi:hypothetical protein